MTTPTKAQKQTAIDLMHTVSQRARFGMAISEDDLNILRASANMLARLLAHRWNLKHEGEVPRLFGPDELDDLVDYVNAPF